MNSIEIKGEKCKVSYDKISQRHYIHGKDYSTFGESLEEAVTKFKTKKA